MKKISERQKLLVTDLIAEKGLNRYVTNIAKSELSDQDVVDYYHDLWHTHVEQVRKQLLKVHEAHLLDERTGKTHVMQMNARELANPLLIDLLEPFFTH